MRNKVYFAASGGRIKIGTTAANVEKRFAEINAFVADPLELIGVTPGGIGLERLFHARFGEFRIKGEWFRDCAELRHLIRQVLLFGPEAVGLRVTPVHEKRITQRQSSARDDVARLVARARDMWPRKTAFHLAFATGCSVRAAKYWLSGTRVPTASAAFAIAAAVESAKRRQPISPGGHA